MIRFLIAAFFVGPGLVHGIMFGLPYVPEARADLPFNPRHSWLIGDTRAFGFAFCALLVTAAFGIAGVGYLARAGWWEEATIAAPVLSLVPLAVYPSRWFIVGYPIIIALAVIAWRAQQTA